MKHLCHRCRHRSSSLFLTRVGLSEGQYTIWNEARAAHFRRHTLPFPRLVWLCMTCHGAESRVFTVASKTNRRHA
jgi:hypothetical protein